MQPHVTNKPLYRFNLFNLFGLAVDSFAQIAFFEYALDRFNLFSDSGLAVDSFAPIAFFE